MNSEQFIKDLEELCSIFSFAEKAVVEDGKLLGGFNLM